MKKFLKITTIALVIIMTCAVLSPVYAVEFENGFNYELINNGTEAKIITAKVSCVGTDGILTIPETLGGKPVTEIAGSALGFIKDRTTSVVFPGTIKVIGDNAFASTKLAGVLVLPVSLRSLGARAFMNCAQITELTINDGLDTIPERAFSGCAALTKITFGNAVKTIGDYAFSACAALAAVDITAPVESVGKSAFFNCQTLAAVTFASSVGTIGSDAFENCPALVEVTVPPTVTSVGSRAFALMDMISGEITHNITITCAQNSAAHKYATKNNADVKLKKFGYFLLGDLDGNGLVEATDARLALRNATELERLSDEQVALGDFDNSGKIEAAEARRILRAATGLETLKK